MAVVCLSHVSISVHATPITLSQTIQRALKQNDELQIAKLEHDKAITHEYDAKADFDLSFTAEGNWTHDEDKPASTLSSKVNNEENINLGLSKKNILGTTLSLDFKNKYKDSGSSTSINGWDPRLELSITQPILKNVFGLNDRQKLKSAAHKKISTQANAKDLTALGLATLIKAYWSLAASEEIVKIQQKAFRDAKRLYHANKKKIKLGTIEQTDLLASQANMLFRDNDLLVANNSHQITQADFKRLLKAPAHEVFSAKDKLKFKEENWDERSTIGQALNNQKAYISQKKDFEAKNLNFLISKNEILPDVNIVASYASNGLSKNYDSALSDIASLDFPTYSAGITFTYPFGNHLATSAYEKARIEKLKAHHNLAILKDKIIHNVKQDLTTLKMLAAKVKKAKTINALLKQKMRAEEKKFFQGRSSINFLIQFQNDYLQQSKELIQTLLDYKYAVIDLKHARGTLYEAFIKAPL